MRVSRILGKTRKEDIGGLCASHNHMVKSAMIQQTTSGIYSWLPIGLKIIRNIENVIRSVIDSESQEILMPTIQSADPWKQSERYEAYGKEMLRINDRAGKELLYGPTNEELSVEIISEHVKSYRDLPKIVHQFQWKFRDEIRPRHGVMRSREFLMKDGYSFDVSEEDSLKSYHSMLKAYMKIFKLMNLVVIPVKAATGPVGGGLSHEFILLSDSGESTVYYDSDILNIDFESETLENINKIYSYEEELHDVVEFSTIPEERRKQSKGIEIGHIFNLGQKYTKSLNFSVDTPFGRTYPYMGCYGIGVSRLVGAIIESSSGNFVWPSRIAPYTMEIINLGFKDQDCIDFCEKQYDGSQLYDDRNERPGVKLSDADLYGCPIKLIVGPKYMKDRKVECRHNGRVDILDIDCFFR